MHERYGTHIDVQTAPAQLYMVNVVTGLSLGLGEHLGFIVSFYTQT